ncbi:MAG: hypothetical protein HY329_10810 [Chloroflexi bacterium]|nr:hypothetical protein [Chloroflexota bacterium]
MKAQHALRLLATTALVTVVGCSTPAPTPAPTAAPPSTSAAAASPAVAKPTVAASLAGSSAQPSPTGAARQASPSPTRGTLGGPPPFDRTKLQYGVQAHQYWIDKEPVVRAANELGFGWLKQQIRWDALEPRKNAFDWAELDRIVEATTTRGGMNLLLSVVAAPKWATGNNPVDGPPTDFSEMGRFIGILADRYKGKVRAYEIWNEQNLHYEWGGQGKLNAAEYVRLLRVNYEAIKRVDRDAVVIAGALTPTGVDDGVIAIDDVRFLQQMYAAGVKNYSDAIGAHPGGYNNPPDDWLDRKTVSSTSFKGHPSLYFRRIEQYRQVMQRNGDADKKVWITEFGYSTRNKAPGYEYGDDVTPQLQAEWLTRAFQKARTEYPWVGAMFIWNLNFATIVPDTDEKWSFGILNPDFTPRPAYTALRNMPK